MVFISFPTSSTSEEDALVKKYHKLSRKRASLEKAAQPEPKTVSTISEKPPEAKDARKLIENLKRTGKLPLITDTGRKSEFKRKIAPKPTAQAQADEALEKREMVSYEDDLFD